MNYDVMKFIAYGGVGLDIYTSKHCNLKCRGCIRFANIAKPQFYDFDQFKIDIVKIKELNFQPQHITMSGGEPLTNPKTIDFVELTRKYFPDIHLGISTNGLLFTRQSDEWYKRCAACNVELTYTKYPTDLIDYDKIHEIGDKYGILIQNINSLSFFTKDTVPQGTRDELDTHHLREPTDLDPVFSKIKKLCICGGDCPAIFNGKVYQCGVVCNVNALNEKYGTNFKVTEDCYVELSKLKNVRELYDFLLKPTSFCRYCYNDENHKFKWERGVVNKDDWLKYYE